MKKIQRLFVATSFFLASGLTLAEHHEFEDAADMRASKVLSPDLNRARLIATGADEALIEEYLENPNMSPSQQTLLTAAIAEIDGAEGRDGILRQALNVETEAEVNFLIRSVTMLAWYHLNQTPVRSVYENVAAMMAVSDS